MDVSRRGFVAGVSASAAIAMSGFLGELRVHGEQPNKPVSKKARILFNENPLGPSPKALQVIESSASLLGRYPLSEGPKLEMKLRKLHGLSYRESTGELSLGPKQKLEGSTDLLLGIGSSEILKAIAWAYCSTGGNIVEAHPSYSAVGDAAEDIPGSKIERRTVPLDSENRLDVRAMIQSIDSSTKVVVICNPNNPTGSSITLDQIESIAKAVPKTGLLLVDEAYIEFLPDYQKVSAIELAKSRSNVLVARTFSKIFGLAGLRIGYGIGSNEVISAMKPFMLGQLSMNMAGVLAADAALDDKAHLDKTIELQLSSKEAWERCFKSKGWRMTASDACFCWVDVGQTASRLVRFLAERDVLISGGQRWNLPNYVRISMGTPEENERLVAGIQAYA